MLLSTPELSSNLSQFLGEKITVYLSNIYTSICCGNH